VREGMGACKGSQFWNGREKLTLEGEVLRDGVSMKGIPCTE
jgi:hypothetical protein